MVSTATTKLPWQRGGTLLSCNQLGEDHHHHHHSWVYILIADKSHRRTHLYWSVTFYAPASTYTRPVLVFTSPSTIFLCLCCRSIFPPPKPIEHCCQLWLTVHYITHTNCASFADAALSHTEESGPEYAEKPNEATGNQKMRLITV